ncbi:L2 [Macaca fascicularis papillomavirus 7]|uniref:Minor capsid protein L2 n=1 Tax=Macaca fascicularis papillomavirus 7 TaxID=471185 RepID=C3PU70_RHPV1|nr:L2 [Macaca fascicularis papillomavirus 7]
MKHARVARRRRDVSGHPRKSRRKRASATQLYQTCKAAGTCPPDVIPKIEGSTVADQILKYGSVGVYFGGLGIGTGSGTGGRTGYIPLGSRPPTSVAPAPRPPVAVEPVGPLDSSVVPLLEESSLINAGVPTPAVPTGSGFDVSTVDISTPAVLDVTPSQTSVRVSVHTYDNPLFTEPSVVHPPPPMEASGHLVLSSTSSSLHSVEEIPMDTFLVTGDNAYNPTSTPIPTTRPPPRLGLYGRAMQQVRVQDPVFLSSPAKLVTIDNPAYEGLGDASLQFEHPSLHEAPDPAFMDIVALHRPALTSRRGTVRFSRVGNRATLRTRSGKQIGARVHYFYDLSSIAQPEDIELQPLGASETPLFDVYADVDDAPAPSQPWHSPTPSRGGSSATATFGAPTWPTTVPLSAGVDVYVQPGPDILSPVPAAESPFYPMPPSIPQGHITVLGGAFYWHPSWYTARKRRKLVPNFLADVSVAA